jgi:hypothetical protein
MTDDPFIDLFMSVSPASRQLLLRVLGLGPIGNHSEQETHELRVALSELHQQLLENEGEETYEP